MKKRSVSNSFHSLDIKQVIKKFDSRFAGLSSVEFKERTRLYGKNVLPKKKPLNPFVIFLKQFHNVMVYILIIAIIISFLIKHYIDAGVIIGVILINAGIGFFQEFKAEKTIRALKRMIVQYAKVYRNGKLIRVKASDLVPGDIILLESGDRIPADARLVETSSFQTVESSITGESLPVEKNSNILPKKLSIADCKNMVWMGTFVTNGIAKAIVVATGKNTEIGKIARDIEKVKDVKSHFREKTDLLAKQMGIIALLGALVTFLIGFFIRNFDLGEMFLVAVASLVSGLPEGLPAVLAIVLAIGSYRMAKRKAIIRKLPATETFGIVNVIVSDKTGTLTRNTLNIEKIFLSGEKEINVSGNGWIPEGNFIQGKNRIIPLENNNLAKLLHISLLCNNSRLFKKKNNYEILGDPTEAAFNVLAEKSGLKREEIEKVEDRIDDLPFNSDVKYRASLIKLKNGKKQLYVIGAPEVLMSFSKSIKRKTKEKKFGKIEKKEIINEIDKLAENAMRVLAVAYKDIRDDAEKIDEKMISDLVFAGLVGMRDPPRDGVKKAVEKAQYSGIRVIMATGDYKKTAISIAKEIGLDSFNGKIKALSEDELNKLNAKEFVKAVSEVNVFARLSPQTKLKIAEILQKKGNVVAMTGDGVNDAPALKKADIGISMGIIGSDVSREASDVVLADDNFVSIVNAVEEGRVVFTNTRQASYFLITTNFAEDATIISTLLFGMPLPLLPVQLLWLNLVTDGVTDVALAMEPNHTDVLQEKPKSAKEGIITMEIIPLIVLMTIVMVVASLFVFNFFLPSGLEKARTGIFVIMAFTQLFNFLNMRSIKKSLFKIGLFSNKYAVLAIGVSITFLLAVLYLPIFQKMFNFVSLTGLELIILIMISSFVLWAGELYKMFKISKPF